MSKSIRQYVNAPVSGHVAGGHITVVNIHVHALGSMARLPGNARQLVRLRRYVQVILKNGGQP